MTEDRDELGGLLRRSAQGAAPLPYDAADTRGRADARRRRTAVAGGVGAAVVAFGVTLAVATTSGGSTALQQQPAGPAPATAPTSAAVPTPSTPPRETDAPVPDARPTTGPSGIPLPPAVTPEVVLPTYGGDAAPGRPTEGTPTQPPPTDPEPTGGEVELRGDDLGVTRVGAARDDAVAAISAVLGEPTRPRLVACIGADEELAWGDFRLSIGADGRVNGWSSTSTTVTTPSGIRVGTRVDRLRDLLGDRLQITPANPDNPEGFRVVGVEVFGDLSGTADEEVVTRLFTGACSGP